VKIINVVFSNIQKILENAEQRKFSRVDVFQWVLENGLSWIDQENDKEIPVGLTTPEGIEIPKRIVELPGNVNWRDCNIIIVNGALPPGRAGSGRRRKNELAKKFAGSPARKWINAWKKIDPSYPVSTNNARMCTKSGYVLLQTPDGLIVNLVP
jgi:hypothetical protein